MKIEIITNLWMWKNWIRECWGWIALSILSIACLTFLVLTPPHKPTPPREVDDFVCILNGLINLAAELHAAHESKPDAIEHDGKKLTAIGYASFMVYRDEKGNLFAHDALDGKFIEYGAQTQK